MHFLQAINSDIRVLIVCNKTGGTIKRDIKKIKHNGIF
jgi:RNase P/RNase MRP subunit POP5